MATRLTQDQLLKWARAGAEATLKELRADVIAIEQTFPELAMTRQRKAVGQALTQVSRRTRGMSAAATRAVSLRMKKYWAERRKAKAKAR